MAYGDVALYRDSHGGVDGSWNKINIIVGKYFFLWFTCHSYMSNRQEVGYRVGEEVVGRDGGPEEREGEDEQGRDQVY